jgi:4-amino-4-deoxy-L-arabinose transferase-like glycosyltransferase
MLETTTRRFETLQARLRWLWRDDNTPLAMLALANVVLHLLVANNYGYFRDELYYLQDGKHLAFGYVDQAPLIGWLAALTNLLFHDSLFGIHIIPALAGGCLIFVAGLLARELGGGRFAQILTALATLLTPTFLATASIFSMDILDALFWTLGAYVTIRLLRRGDPHLWLAFGAVAGLSLLNKLTILFFGLGIVIGFLLTPQRKQFLTRRPWLGGLIAAAGLLPYALWNAVTGWPTVAFWHHYPGLSGGGPIGFLANQIIAAGPLNVPLAIIGLLFYLRDPAGKAYRALGWAYVTLYVILMLINAKAYFLAPIYPMLFAGGARQLEAAWQARRRWSVPAYIAALVLAGVALIPLTMPLLPPAIFAHSYAALTGVGNGGAGQSNAGVFPQYLGDRFGWDTLTARVKGIYDALPADERRQACVFTMNYGEAGALQLLGGSALPPVISGHNNYYLWGPGSCTGQALIVVGVDPTDPAGFTAFASRYYGQISPQGAFTCTYCMGSENGTLFYLLTQPKQPLAKIWPLLKHFD